MLNKNDTIIVNAWKNFPENRMTCINIYEDATMNMPVYVFDNGMTLFEIELENNFDLWNSRNGYRIENNNN